MCILYMMDCSIYWSSHLFWNCRVWPCVISREADELSGWNLSSFHIVKASVERIIFFRVETYVVHCVYDICYNKVLTVPLNSFWFWEFQLLVVRIYSQSLVIHYSGEKCDVLDIEQSACCLREFDWSRSWRRVVPPNEVYKYVHYIDIIRKERVFSLFKSLCDCNIWVLVDLLDMCA